MKGKSIVSRQMISPPRSSWPRSTTRSQPNRLRRSVVAADVSRRIRPHHVNRSRQGAGRTIEQPAGSNRNRLLTSAATRRRSPNPVHPVKTSSSPRSLRFCASCLFLVCLLPFSAVSQIQQAWAVHYNNGILNGTNQALKMALDTHNHLLDQVQLPRLPSIQQITPISPAARLVLIPSMTL